MTVRYALLADVHGNLDALRAVLRAVEEQGVDGYLFAGDLVGYGRTRTSASKRWRRCPRPAWRATTT